MPGAYRKWLIGYSSAMIEASPAGIEHALRVSLVALAIFVALLAIGAMRARRALRLLAALSALATGAYAACSSSGFAGWHGVSAAQWPVLLLCAALPAIFWAFARAWFDDEYAPGWDAAGAIVLLGALGFLALELRASATGIAVALGTVRRLLAAALLAHLLWRVWRGAPSDLVDERLKARAVLIWVAGLYILGVLVAELWLAGVQPPPGVQILNVSAIWLVTALTGIALARWDLSDPPAAVSPAPRPRLSPAEARLIAALEHAMREQRLYREEGLSIAGLAARLGTQEHRLRRAINRGLGLRNFNEFLHGYRLEEVARRLRAAEDAHLPILTLALEAGYSSIGPFNRAFKARYGVTPSAYRGRGRL